MSVSVAARPGPFAFDPAATALLVIDMQGDFLLPGGFGAALGNDVGQLARVVEPTRALLQAARAAGLLVVHTREGHRPDLSDCPPAKRARGREGLQIGDPGPMGRILVRGERGWDIVADLSPQPGEPIVDKPGKGAFHATDLEHLLRARGVEHLLVAGVTTEVCVQTTVREANDRGFRCLVLADCTASYFPEFHRVTLDMIAAQGAIAGWVGESSDVLKALSPGTSDEPERLVRRFYEEALNGRRDDAFAALLADDVTYHNPATGPAHGPAAVQAAIAALRAAFPDLRYEVHEVLRDGDRVLARFTLRGTHRGPFRGQAATDTAIEVGGCTVYGTGAGKITELRVFVDLAGILQQIGAVSGERPVEADPGYHALFAAHQAAGRLDAAYCVARTRVFLDQATPAERALVDKHRGTAPRQARQQLTEELLRRHVFHPDEDLWLTGIFGTLAPAIAAWRAQPLPASLAPGDRLDVDAIRPQVAPMARYISQVLNVARPDIYLQSDPAGAVTLLNAQRDGRVHPSLLVARELLGGEDRHLLFVLGRRMSDLYLPHYAHVALDRAPEHLRLVFRASLHMCDLECSGDRLELDRIARELRSRLPPNTREQLRDLLQRALKAGPPDVARWGAGVELTADRVGFLLCDDLDTAARQLLCEPAGPAGTAEERIEALVRWSVSDDYLAARAGAGLALA